MARPSFDRETLLDLSVNIIPVAILLVFSIVFLSASQWEPDLWMELLTQFLTLFPLVLLAALTYVAASAIEGS